MHIHIHIHMHVHLHMCIYIYRERERCRYTCVYIAARPRTREHAFRRTHYRIKGGSRTLPNTTVKHPPNTANTGTHPNTRSPPAPPPRTHEHKPEHAFSEHTNTNPKSEHKPEHCQAAWPPGCQTAYVPACLHCQQTLPAGTASRLLQQALPLPERSHNSARPLPGLSHKSARPPPLNTKQPIIDARGVVAQICATTPGPEESHNFATAPALTMPALIPGTCLGSTQGALGYEPNMLTTAPLRFFLR